MLLHSENYRKIFLVKLHLQKIWSNIKFILNHLNTLCFFWLYSWQFPWYCKKWIKSHMGSTGSVNRSCKQSTVSVPCWLINLSQVCWYAISHERLSLVDHCCALGVILCLVQFSLFSNQIYTVHSKQVQLVINMHCVHVHLYSVGKGDIHELGPLCQVMVKRTLYHNQLLWKFK